MHAVCDSLEKNEYSILGRKSWSIYHIKSYIIGECAAGIWIGDEKRKKVYILFVILVDWGKKEKIFSFDISFVLTQLFCILLSFSRTHRLDDVTLTLEDFVYQPVLDDEVSSSANISCSNVASSSSTAAGFHYQHQISKSAPHSIKNSSEVIAIVLHPPDDEEDEVDEEEEGREEDLEDLNGLEERKLRKIGKKKKPLLLNKGGRRSTSLDIEDSQGIGERLLQVVSERGTYLRVVCCYT